MQKHFAQLRFLISVGWDKIVVCLVMSVRFGILKMVGSKMQGFCPRINMLKGIFFKKIPTTNAGSSKSAEIVL